MDALQLVRKEILANVQWPDQTVWSRDSSYRSSEEDGDKEVCATWLLLSKNKLKLLHLT